MADSLKDRVREDLNAARRERDKLRTTVLTTFLSDIRNREIDQGSELSDEEIATLIGWHAARRLCNLNFDLQGRSPRMHKGWRAFADKRPTAH